MSAPKRKCGLLEADWQKRWLVERGLEIISEASRHLTEEVKALLETTELIVRGEIRKRIPFRDLQDLRVEHGKLCFTTGGDAVALFLGEAPSQAWAKAISTPPTLAKKLGISGKTVFAAVGPYSLSVSKLAALAKLAKKL